MERTLAFGTAGGSAQRRVRALILAAIFLLGGTGQGLAGPDCPHHDDPARTHAAVGFEVEPCDEASRAEAGSTAREPGHDPHHGHGHIELPPGQSPAPAAPVRNGAAAAWESAHHGRDAGQHSGTHEDEHPCGCMGPCQGPAAWVMPSGSEVASAFPQERQTVVLPAGNEAEPGRDPPYLLPYANGPPAIA